MPDIGRVVANGQHGLLHYLHAVMLSVHGGHPKAQHDGDVVVRTARITHTCYVPATRPHGTRTVPHGADAPHGTRCQRRLGLSRCGYQPKTCAWTHGYRCGCTAAMQPPKRAYLQEPCQSEWRLVRRYTPNRHELSARARGQTLGVRHYARLHRIGHTRAVQYVQSAYIMGEIGAPISKSFHKQGKQKCPPSALKAADGI